MTDIEMNRINEMIDVLYECTTHIDEVWSSDHTYNECVEEVIHTYSRTLGQISGKITALKIAAKKEKFYEEQNNNIH